MSELIEIQQELSKYFGSTVTVNKLRNACGSQTVIYAKSIGIYLAKKEGYSNKSIANNFGYTKANSVSRIFSAISNDIPLGREIGRDVNAIANELSIDLHAVLL